VETALTSGQTIKYNGTIWTNYTPDHTDLANKGTNTHAQIDSFITNQNLIYSTKGEITGFEDPAGIVLTYFPGPGPGTPYLQISHSSGTIAYWIKGTRYTRSSPYLTAPHTDSTANNYYGYFKDDNTWTWETSFQGFNNLGWVYVAFVYYKSDAKFALRECHGLMEWETWGNLHTNIGTYRSGSGGLVTGGISQNTNTAAAIKPTTAEVTLMDEDLPSTVFAVDSGLRTYTTVHFIGGAPVFTSGLTWPFLYSGTEIQYNPSATSLAVVGGNNRWVNYYGVYLPVTADTTSAEYRLVWIAGQAFYTSLLAAQQEDFRSLDTTAFGSVFLEFLPFIRLTIRRDSTYNNIRMARIDASTPFVTYLSGSKSGYVTIAGFSAAAATRFTQSFTTSDWGGVVGAQTLAITGATHGKGTYPSISVWYDEGTGSESLVGVDISVSRTTGDITLTSSETFNGTLVVL
jgi:hypothetical protein